LTGLGTFELSQLTLETLEVLKSVNVVYHLTARHADLCAINPHTRDLNDQYFKAGLREDIYASMAQYLVGAARTEGPIALALDGNPMFFSDISWMTSAFARKEGLTVEALPAVSCIDVLPMQLGFEPADLGLQIFEATQMVLYNLIINAYLSTLVLQIAYFMERVTTPMPERPAGSFDCLVTHLLKFFPPHHPAIFIQSAYSAERPTVTFSTQVGSIDQCRNRMASGMTLYLPRVGIPKIDLALRERLGLK
jgi:hypothetical protein